MNPVNTVNLVDHVEVLTYESNTQSNSFANVSYHPSANQRRWTG